MMLVVTFVSLHGGIHTIGWAWRKIEGHALLSPTFRCSFAMPMLVMSNNFVQLFFWLGSPGWCLYC